MASVLSVSIGMPSPGEDLVISGAGDFTNVESTYQHQRQLIFNAPGDFKQNPLVCVGANNYIDDEGSGDIVRAIVQQFMGDGMEVVNMSPNPNSVVDDEVVIFENAYYI